MKVMMNLHGSRCLVAALLFGLLGLAGCPKPETSRGSPRTTSPSISGLKELTSLALTNSVINDSTVDMIVKSFPNLIELDLSSNTNMTNSVVKTISELGKLQRLTLVQNQVNDIGARRLEKLKELRTL